MEEHALNGEYISVLRNGVLSYGDVPAMVGQRSAHTALVGRNSTAADRRTAPPCCARYWT